MNKTMYIFTVLAGIFLPITFVTGLFWHQCRWHSRI
ncbi:MAG: CorA family divalent cation transporter [Nitrospirota bacterium]